MLSLSQSCSVEAPKTSHDLIRLGVYMLLSVFAIITYGTYRCRSPQFQDPFTHSIVGDHPLNKYVD
jgi:hypothetical protein